MPRRLTVALALLSAVTGCISPPPTGALVEYNPGQAPVTRKVECPATYVLVAPDRQLPIVEHRAVKGEQLGFRQDSDGSVAAVAPGYTFPLPPGAYRWEVVQSSVPSARERFWCEARAHGLVAAKVTGIALLVALVAVLVLCVLFIIAFSPRFT